MKTKPIVWILLGIILCACVCHSPAQGSIIDRKLFDEVRAEAEVGDATAQLIVGTCHYIGEVVEVNYEEAVRWFRKAAAQESAHAQFYLGFCYESGDGVSKDMALAVNWYRKAAEKGEPQAQCQLGVSYGKGDGIDKNMGEAAKWFRKAAIQGNALAQKNLGVCCYYGEGVPSDYVEAHKWFNLAAASNNEDARKFLRLVERKMTLAQVAEAQQMAREFKRVQPNVGTPAVPGVAIGAVASGTGFFISEDGHLISNAHVVEGAAQIRLVTSKGFISAKVVKVDAANDLALLKADGKFSALPVTASRGVQLGGTVATVGFPNIGLQGFAPKLAKGEIASLSGAADDARYFQISVPVQPGNSGGALVDERGNVVGVVSAKLSARAALATSGALPENVNYAVKSSYLLSFLESVPEVAAKLKEARTGERKFEEVVKDAEQAAVLVLVY